MKEKINERIDKLGLFFICVIIIILNIYIGSNIKEPIYIIQMLAIIFGTIYCIIKKIVSKENIFIKGKIDIAILLLLISTMLPLIFKTYISFSGTYNFILKYISMYSIYILTRNIVINKKRIKIIVNTIIISSIFVMIMAIDFQYFHILNEFMIKINSVRIENSRMGRTIWVS